MPSMNQKGNGNVIDNREGKIIIGNRNSKIAISIAIGVAAVIGIIVYFTIVGSFSLNGKWKNVGSDGFGQAQPGAVVMFDGKNCNFYSPQDTYAFYKEGNSYRLDLTSLLFAENLSFTVKVIDKDQIEILSGSTTVILKRVG